jgi:hypothetical protein
MQIIYSVNLPKFWGAVGSDWHGLWTAISIKSVELAKDRNQKKKKKLNILQYISRVCPPKWENYKRTEH